MNADERRCPKCGKAMIETPGFPGLWICEDGQTPITDAAPFQFKCYGVELSAAAVEAFAAELNRQIALRN